MNSQTKEEKATVELGKLGVKIGRVDQLSILIAARRMHLSRKVAETKLGLGQKTYRAVKERERLDSVRAWAKDIGIRPEFAEAMLYNIIGESCKEQIIFTENQNNPDPNEIFHGSPIITGDTEEGRYQHLKRNLLCLTKDWAETYDTKYGSHRFATHQQFLFEHQKLLKEIEDIEDRDVLLDLGCATGRETLQYVQSFKYVVGYDISPEMISVACRKIQTEGIKNATFKVHDIENGLPEISDQSVSLVYMNFGTASDIRDIKTVFSECKRVLKIRGKFLFSFYNSKSLACRKFIPWPINLAAEMDLDRNCLEVMDEKRMLPIFAKAYEPNQEQFERDILPKHMVISSFTTHPTISSILPPDLFEDTELQALFTKIDEGLASNAGSDLFGSYIVMTGSRTQ